MVEPTFAPQLPAPPQRKRPPWKWIIAAAVLVVVLCCGGGVALFGRTFFEINDVREAARVYLTYAQNGDYNGAYQQLCAKAQLETTPSQLADLPRLNSFEITGATVQHRIPQGESAIVTATLHMTEGRTVSQSFYFVKEGGKWKVCD